jgi:hypothetical protein
MTSRKAAALAAVILMSAAASASRAAAQSQEPPKVKIPEAGVPQIMTLQGRYIRAAYNNEGYAILGYRLANTSVGEEWMLLEVGLTVRDGVPPFKLTRDAVSLDTPDGKTLPMPSVSEYREANLRALEERSKVIRDSINYFPPSANRGCRIGFFAPLEGPALPYDNVELSSERACVGRLFFHVPGGIKYGQHFLNIKFEKSVVRVPFRILTEEEQKTLEKHYKSIEKQVKEAFAPKKK